MRFSIKKKAPLALVAGVGEHEPRVVRILRGRPGKAIGNFN
jgi:hypothetical protein